MAISTVFYSLALAENDSWLERKSGHGGKTMLANSGNAMFSVRVAAAADAVERHAAQELAHYLSQVAGATFQFAESDSMPTEPALIVGQHPATAVLVPGLSDEPLGDDGFLIRGQSRRLGLSHQF